MQLLVVGAGEMGRWFARHSGATTVAFADRDPAVASDAASAFDNGRSVPLDTDERFDVVCLAVPMTATPDAIADHAAKATAAVVDVSGEMRDSVAALESHGDGRERASFHPLFAAENAPGNVPVVVVEDGPTIATIRETLTEAGNTVFETTPETHDRAMETVQTKAHTAVLAYALAGEDVDERFHTTLSGPLADVVEQVVDNAPYVYADIQERFDGADELADAARAIADAEREAFVDLYDEAGR